MSKYLITANSGAGKSTVIKALKERGYTAYDTDDMPDVTRLQDMKTGKFVDWPDPPIDWTRYGWNWQAKALADILASDETVFIGGVVSNQADFYHLFDHVFVLTLDAQTVRHRLLSRTEKDFGKHPDELAGLLEHHDNRQARFLAEPQAIAIDASQPVGQVVDEILSHVKPKS